MQNKLNNASKKLQKTLCYARLNARLNALAAKHNYKLTSAERSEIAIAIAEATFDVLVQDVTVQQWDALRDAHLVYEIAVCKQDQALQAAMQAK